jgi:ribosomal protein L40E
VANKAEKKGKRKEQGKQDTQMMNCPMCGAKVPADAKECPKCEEPFSPEAFTKARLSKSSKGFFWAGVLLMLAGGAVAFGSWLYDLLELDFVGTSSPGFGLYNRLFALIGIIILVIGIIFLIISLSKMEKQDLEDIDIKENDQGG